MVFELGSHFVDVISELLLFVQIVYVLRHLSCNHLGKIYFYRRFSLVIGMSTKQWRNYGTGASTPYKRWEQMLHEKIKGEGFWEVRGN